MLQLASAFLVLAASHPRLTGEWEGPERDVSIEVERKSADVVIRDIAKQAGWSIVMEPAKETELTLRLKNVPADLALGAVLDAANMVAERRGPVITIRHGTPLMERRVTVVGEHGEEHAEEHAEEHGGPPLLPGQIQIGKEGDEAVARLEAEAAKLDALAESEKDEEHASDLREKASNLREKVSDLREKFADLHEREAELREKMIEQREKYRLKFRGRGREDRVLIGQNLIVATGEEVGDAVAIGGNLTVESGAVVRGDAASFGGNLTLQDGAEVRGDVQCFGGNLDVAPTAVVRGDRIVFGGAEILREIRKELRPGNIVEAMKPEPDEWWDWGAVGRWLLAFIGFFALSFMVRALWGDRVRAATSVFLGNPGRTAVAGVIGAFAVIPLTVVLAVTLIGIPLIPVLFFSVVIATFFGMVVLAVYIGDQVPLGKYKSPVVALAAGVLAMLLVTLIPFVGPLLLWLSSILGLGIAVSSRVGQPARPGDAEPPPAAA